MVWMAFEKRRERYLRNLVRIALSSSVRTGSGMGGGDEVEEGKVEVGVGVEGAEGEEGGG